VITLKTLNKVKWKSGSLSDIAQVVMGQSPPGISYNTEQIGVGLINGPTEFTNKYPVVKQWTSKPTKFCKPGDILLCVRGSSTGRMNISDGNYCIGRGVASVSAKAGKGVTEFVHYLLDYKINKLLMRTAGSTFPNLSSDEIKDMDISIPNLEEQHKITSILSTWDKAIELKEKLIENKKEQKKALMQKLLTGEVRLPGFNEKWKEVTLDRVVKKTKGKAIEYIEGGKYPAIDMDYLETGTFKNFSNDATIFAKENDVLFLWDGSRAGKAFTGVVGSVGSTFVKLECKSINNVFLQKHLEMNESMIQRLREGSGIPHVPKDFLRYYKVNLPSEDEQEAIALVLGCVDKSLLLHEKEIIELQQQKKGLMQLLLTGKVRVKA
jgi:type I restriction enzyme S subunit